MRLTRVGASEVEVVADDRLEEDPPRAGPVEHLGQGELGLEDRDVVAVAGPSVTSAVGMGQTGRPLADKALDLGGAERKADVLERGRIRAALEPIVEGLEVEAGLFGLTLGPLVAVDAAFPHVGEAGPELDEEGPEVESSKPWQ